MGSQGGEDSHCVAGQTGRVWDEQGRQSDHWQTLRPHICADKPRGPDSRVAENGAGRAVGSTLGPHIRAQINRAKGGERSRLRNTGLQLREIKPQTSD